MADTAGNVNDTEIPTGDDTEFWIFGYGSLIWKPPIHFDRRVPGYITTHVRRFWQASTDHRGTTTYPGRVVTLITRDFWGSLAATSVIKDVHGAPDRVWGVAYRIPKQKVEEVRAYLDIREVCGYEVQYTEFYPVARQGEGVNGSDGTFVADKDARRGEEKQDVIRTLVYIGTPENEQFVGVQNVQALAEHICRSEGPSGKNADYLLELDVALRELSPESEDEHVSDLASRVKQILESRSRQDGREIVAEVQHDEELEGGSSIVPEEVEPI